MGLLRRYLDLCARRGEWLLLAAFALTGLAVLSALSLRVDTRLEALLPDDARSVRALEEAEARVPTRSPLVMLVSSSDAELNRRLADQLAEGVRAWPETQWAITERSPEGLWERRLLFAPAEDLEGWANTVEDRVAWERCARVPGCVNFDDRPDLPTEAEVRQRLEEVPELASLSRFFGEGGADGADGRASTGGADVAEADRAPEGRLCSADGTVCAVEASLSAPSNNLAVAQDILARAEALIARARPADAPSDLQMEVSGPFRNAPMTTRVTQNDLTLVSIVSTLLVALVLWVQFRGARSALVVLLPMGAAVAWVLGGLGLAGVELNIISAFTFAILVGIGIDYGIHLATHYGAERERGLAPLDAMEDTLRSLGRSLCIAAATTAFAFASLMAAAFRGFSQMGALAALGVLASLFAFFLLVPPMVLVLHRVWPERGSWMRRWGPRRRGDAPRLPRLRATLGLLVGVGLAVVGAGVTLETDFRNLRPEGVAHGLPTSSAVHGTSGLGVQVIGEDEDAVLRATWAVHDRVVSDGLSASGDVLALTAHTFLPSDQGQRLAAVHRLRAAIDDALRRAEDGDRARLESLRPLVDIERPIEPDDLPPWIAEWLLDTEGELGKLGLVFLRARGTDAVEMERLARILDQVSEEHPEVLVASAPAVLGEVLPGLFRDGPLMVGLSLLGLCLAVWGLGRSLPRVGWVLLPVLLAAGMTAGLMALLDIKLNLYNLMVLPVAFGMGVDGAIYVVWAAGDRETAQARLANTRRAIVGSTLTTMLAFGSLVLSHHLGVESIGRLGFLAIGTTLVANLLWLPAVLHLWGRFQAHRTGRGASAPTSKVDGATEDGAAGDGEDTDGQMGEVAGSSV